MSMPPTSWSADVCYFRLVRPGGSRSQGQDYFEERYRERVIRQISQRAAKLGLSVVPTPHAA